MSQSMLLPAFVALFGVVGAIFLVGGFPARVGQEFADDDDVTDWIPVYDEGYDDDESLEYEVPREPDDDRRAYPPAPSRPTTRPSRSCGAVPIPSRCHHRSDSPTTAFTSTRAAAGSLICSLTSTPTRPNPARGTG